MKFNEHLTIQIILLLLKITCLYFVINYKLSTAIKLCLTCNAGHSYYVKIVSVLKVIW